MTNQEASGQDKMTGEEGMAEDSQREPVEEFDFCFEDMRGSQKDAEWRNDKVKLSEPQEHIRVQDPTVQVRWPAKLTGLGLGWGHTAELTKLFIKHLSSTHEAPFHPSTEKKVIIIILMPTCWD
jgi:hypothetical protein